MPVAGLIAVIIMIAYVLIRLWLALESMGALRGRLLAASSAFLFAQPHRCRLVLTSMKKYDVLACLL